MIAIIKCNNYFMIFMSIFGSIVSVNMQSTLASLVKRDDWGARIPKLIEKFNGPSQYVIIHHSYIPSACYNENDCKIAMRSMQDFHQNDRGWNDIGYSFAIGGDGRIYYGRGFNIVGAHAPGYNKNSVGICIIGDWTSTLPPQNMLSAVHDLIDFGVSKGYIDKNYKLMGHRQVRDTECPGAILFNEIKTWPHFKHTLNSTTNINEVSST